MQHAVLRHQPDARNTSTDPEVRRPLGAVEHRAAAVLGHGVHEAARVLRVEEYRVALPAGRGRGGGGEGHRHRLSTQHARPGDEGARREGGWGAGGWGTLRGRTAKDDSHSAVILASQEFASVTTAGSSAGSAPPSSHPAGSSAFGKTV